jgi:exopolysaccharide production protein ExoQ
LRRINDTSDVIRRHPTNVGSPGQARARVEAPWKRDGRWAWLFAALLWILILYSAIPLDIFSGSPADGSELWLPNPLSRVFKLVLLGTGISMILVRAKLSWLLFRTANSFLIAFLILVPLSILWSIDRSATLARFVTLLSIVAVSFAFCLAGWHARRFQTVIRPALTVILLGSLIFGFLEPTLAVELGEGTLKNAWHGLMSQKNQFGQAASFGVIFWFHAYVSKEVRSWRAMAGIAIAGLCLLLSRSSASLIATVFAAILILLMLKVPSNVRRYLPYIVAIFACVVAVYAIAALKLIPGLEVVLSPITMLTGKDMTFSNRSVIWAIVEDHIRLSPYIGSGYGAYWTGVIPTSPSYVFLSKMYFYPSQSHNGYLEIINDLGFCGLFVLLGYFAVYIRQSLRLMRIDRIQAALFLSFFFQHMIVNLSETAWLATSSPFTTTIMTTATFCIARSLLQQRFQLVWGFPKFAQRWRTPACR